MKVHPVIVSSLQMALISCLALAAHAEGATSRDELAHWINENAIVLPSLDADLSSPQLDALVKDMKGKRIVFLGEASHWVHEKYDYRLLLLKRLVAEGFTNIGMEMGFSDGQRVDQFLASGEPKDFDRIALYGHRNRDVRPRPVAGACPSRKTYAGLAPLFKGEEFWFYSKLRRFGSVARAEGERIHHFGYDLDTLPGGGYEDVRKLLQPHWKNAVVAGVLELLEAPDSESPEKELQRLRATLENIDQQMAELGAILTEKTANRVRFSLRVLLESLELVFYFNSRPCDPLQLAPWARGLTQIMANRERMMFEIMKAKLDELGANSKIVLMGHNFHLSKNPRSLRFAAASVPDPIAAPMWPSIGEFVSQTLDIPVYSVWMIEAMGSQSGAGCESRECPIERGVDYLGRLLMNGHPAYLLPLGKPLDSRARSLDQRLSFAVQGGSYSGNIVENADVIFFVETVSGLKQRTSSGQ